jgi:hypothetical protein
MEDAEIKKIIESVINYKSQESDGVFSEDDVVKALAWCKKTIIDNALLGMVLSGEVLIGIDSGNVVFVKNKETH